MIMRIITATWIHHMQRNSHLIKHGHESVYAVQFRVVLQHHVGKEHDLDYLIRISEQLCSRVGQKRTDQSRIDRKGD